MPSFKRIAVTGGAGKAGRVAVTHLREHGYRVINLDRAAGQGARIVELTDFGQTIDALAGCEAVVHLAAIPAPGIATDQATFANNILSTYNVFLAAKMLGITRVVWASSETTLGLPLNEHPPAAAPIREDDPLNPRSSYAHSKQLGEEMGRYFHATAGITSAALRLSNVMLPEHYAKFETWQDKPESRAWNMWGYIDARDAAEACRLALEADFNGAEPLIIAADDTVMRDKSADLMDRFFPQVKLRDLPHDRATLLGIGKAKRLLGWEPKHRWQDEVA